MGGAAAVLVTGARGFLGRALCRFLQEMGVDVVGLGRSAVAGPWSRFVRCDLGLEQPPAEALANVTTIFHLAGKAHALSEAIQDEDEYFRINTEGTKRLLQAAQAAGVRRFVFFSSIKAMGEGTASDQPEDETAPLRPQTPYGRSKLAAEKLVLQGGYVPEPVVLRLSMVYGPTRKGNLPRMIEAVATGRFPPLPEFGNKRSMVHVDDVVQAALLAAEKDAAAGNTYIVTDGQAYSTRRIYEWICEALGRTVPRWHVPVWMLRALAHTGDALEHLLARRLSFDSDALAKLACSAWYSNDRITGELGFRPQYDLRQSLPELVRFLGLR